MEENKEICEISELEMLKRGSQVLLLRHANSTYNFAYSEMIKNAYTDDDYKKLRIKKELRDAPLSKLGVQQCEKAQLLANQLKVEYVLVSPLRRALQTAYHTFKNHPNFENIQFILVPKLREAIDTSWDIPLNIQDTVKEFQKKFKNFSFAEIEKYGDIPHYFLIDINQDFAKKILSLKVADEEDPLGSNAFELLLEFINETYPVKSESRKNILNRIAEVQKFIRTLQTTKKIDEDSKIVCVGHSYYFKMWTGRWERPISEYDEVPEPKESVWLNNCQFYPDSVNFPMASPSAEL